jgi:translation elongation factor EF-Tu-like GTPase
VKFLTTSDGGRQTPVASGYRGQFHLHGLDDIADVEWYFDVASVAPGEASSCQISFARPDHHLPRINVGDAFEIREGRRVVARGIVQRLLTTPDSA